jgi:hypothetical protein
LTIDRRRGVECEAASAAAAHAEGTIELFFVPDQRIQPDTAWNIAGMEPVMAGRRRFDAGVDGRTCLKVHCGDFRLRGRDESR